MRRRASLAVCTTLAGLVLLAAPASAQVGGTVKIAIDPSIGGTMHDAATGTIQSLNISLDSESWTDTHSRRSPLFVAGVDFPAGSDAVQVLVDFEYGRAGAQTTQPGTVNGSPMRALFDRYQFWGLDGGVRLGLKRGGGPYGVATVGMRRVSAIGGRFDTAGGATLVLSDVYDASVVPTFGFGGGVLFGPIGFEVMAKYAGALTMAESAAGTAAAAIATDGARWSLPISLVIQF